MLPQVNRLRADQDIKTLFAKSRGVFGELCGLRFVRTRLPHARVAVAVSTKISKSAVVRNRLKRRYVAILQRRLSSLPRGFDLMILVKPSAVGRTSLDLEKDLFVVLKKAKLFG